MGYLPLEGSSLADCQQAYDHHYNSGGVSYKRREQQIVVDGFVHAAGWKPGMSILDVGCGIGFHAQLLSRRGFGVTGIDFSKSAIALTASRPGPSYILQDATTYAPKQTFDGILFNDFSLFHYELNGMSHLGVDMNAFIARIFTWLSPSGSMLIKAPTNFRGIDKNSLVDFASALHPHAGNLTHSSDAHTILITASSKGATPKQAPDPERPPETRPAPEPEPDVAPAPDPVPDKSQESEVERLTAEDVASDPMGYPDPWGYGNKS